MNILELLETWQGSQMKISCGDSHGAVITSEKSVYMWRDGEKRTLVQGLPTKIFARSVSCGHNHTVVVTTDNRVFTCGSNIHGELGLSDTNMRLQLTPLALDEPVEYACGGKDFTLILTKSNKILWSGLLEVTGKSVDGVNPIHEHNTSTPQEIPIQHKLLHSERVSKICAGSRHILVLTNQNRLFSAGSAAQSQLGRFVTTSEPNCELHEVQFETAPKWPIVQISAGVAHSLVLLGDGSVYSFGTSSSGELGLPKFQNAMLPRLIPNLPKALSISAGHQHSLILGARTNKIVAFGMGALGQLGYRGSFWSSSYPRDSPLPKEQTRIKHISAGNGFSVCTSSKGEDMFACGRSSLCAGAGNGEKSQDVLSVFSRVPS
jgi:alpha-tubulin suppressor-like RCC1 family protein